MPIAIGTYDEWGDWLDGIVATINFHPYQNRMSSCRSGNLLPGLGMPQIQISFRSAINRDRSVWINRWKNQ